MQINEVMLHHPGLAAIRNAQGSCLTETMPVSGALKQGLDRAINSKNRRNFMASPQLFKKILLIKGLIVLLLISSPFTLFAADKHIDLTVYQNGTSSKMRFDNSECPASLQDNGCIEVLRGKSPMISWELESASNEDWKLTRLQFSPDGQHWGDANYKLETCTSDAFGLSDADRTSGEASTAEVVANGRLLKIRDTNRKACTTYYKLFAEPRDGGAEINSDPVIKNRG
jgi:hypothetical protein